MKMIRAIIRPESVQPVIKALEKIGIDAMTRMNVTGRGKEMGITMGDIRYTEIPKEMLMIVVPDYMVAKVVITIKNVARTSGTMSHSDTGNIGDGKIFVSEVDEAYTIRTSEKTIGTERV
jgi:nitrogen regulatory protein PII 1